MKKSRVDLLPKNYSPKPGKASVTDTLKTSVTDALKNAADEASAVEKENENEKIREKATADEKTKANESEKANEKANANEKSKAKSNEMGNANDNLGDVNACIAGSVIGPISARACTRK